ncbi:MAG: DUF4382 domain-containing protein [Nanobdellota archaeon]
MKWIKNIGVVFALLVLMTFSVTAVKAQPELSGPGTTPDSPFYFLDKMFDRFQSSESLADERASEMVAMVEKGNEKAFEKARQGYDKVMENREKQARENEKKAEGLARQASNHMAVLAQVRENASEQVRKGIDKAINKSVQGRGNALFALKNKNSKRAESVAKATLEEVLAHAPEAAKPGLQRALEAQNRKGVQSGKTQGNASEDKGKSEVVPGKEGTKGNAKYTENVSRQIPRDSEDAGRKSVEKNEQEMQESSETVTQGENFRMLVSDAPADIADFDNMDVELGRTRIFSENEAGFEERELDVTVDLTQLVGAASTEVLETELEPGVYNKVELYVDSIKATVNNESADVFVPSGKLQLVKSFEIVKDDVTTFVFDINVVRKGQGNEYNLLPVISESGVVGKDLAESEVEEVEENETEDEQESEKEIEEDCKSSADCEEGFECVRGECEKIEKEDAESRNNPLNKSEQPPKTRKADN